MQYSANLHLNLPEDSDPLEVSKLSENFEALDGALGSGAAALVKSMKIGDITYSTRNLEAESGGVLIACDQREVLVSAYPELCALPEIKGRLRKDFSAYPGPAGTASVLIATPSYNDKVGERYIFTKTSNGDISLYDLISGQSQSMSSIATTNGGRYIDDECVIYEYGSTNYVSKIGNLSARAKLYNANGGRVVRFSDKYLFFGLNNGSTGADMLAYFAPASTVTAGGTASISAIEAVFVPNSGYTVNKLNNYIRRSYDGKSVETPFSGPLSQYGDKLLILQPVQNVVDTTEKRLGLFSTTDGANWNQEYQLPTLFNNTQIVVCVSLGVIGDKIYVCYSEYLAGQVDRITVEEIDAATMELSRRLEFDNAHFVADKGAVVQYNCLYANIQTAGGALRTVKINLDTGEESSLSLPVWVYVPHPDTNTFTNIYPTLLSAEVAISVGAGTGVNSITRLVDRYDFEKGRVANGTTISKAKIADPVDLLLHPLANLPYNSTYYFMTSATGQAVMVYRREQNTRVLPYIQNGYIKALNEEVSE